MELHQKDQNEIHNNVTPIPAEGKNKSVGIIVESGKNGLITRPDQFPHNLAHKLGLFLGQNGQAYAELREAGNPYALAIGSSKISNIIRQLAHIEGITLRKADISDLNHHLQAQAEMEGIAKNVWYRVAPISGGIEIDIGDIKQTRIRVNPGNVEIVTTGSETLFYRTKSMQPMVLPAKVGNLKLLEKYLNLDAASVVLFIAWLSFTLAHPKVPSSKFPILVLQGNQGSGKSALCKIIIQLIDPCMIGVQLMPNKPNDLAIAAQNSHVLCFDNIREFKQSTSDLLCIAATGGALTSRQLYTDADQSVLYLHVALVLNGIHNFVSEPDLAQRCLPLEMRPLPEESRRSEADIAKEFHEDLPAIMRGLFNLIADVLKHLPDAEFSKPERMIDFVKWLAGMELADGVPPGVYQSAYSFSIQQGQLDSLLDNTLAAAILDFAQTHIKESWTGTPAELLIALNKFSNIQTQRSREWPQNPIALSKRLKPLQHALMSQGISFEFARGKNRTITIKVQGENHE